MTNGKSIVQSKVGCALVYADINTITIDSQMYQHLNTNLVHCYKQLNTDLTICTYNSIIYCTLQISKEKQF